MRATREGDIYLGVLWGILKVCAANLNRSGEIPGISPTSTHNNGPQPLSLFTITAFTTLGQLSSTVDW